MLLLKTIDQTYFTQIIYLISLKFLCNICVIHSPPFDPDKRRKSWEIRVYQKYSKSGLWLILGRPPPPPALSCWSHTAVQPHVPAVPHWVPMLQKHSHFSQRCPALIPLRPAFPSHFPMALEVQAEVSAVEAGSPSSQPYFLVSHPVDTALAR